MYSGDSKLASKCEWHTDKKEFITNGYIHTTTTTTKQRVVSTHVSACVDGERLPSNKQTTLIKIVKYHNTKIERI